MKKILCALALAGAAMTALSGAAAAEKYRISSEVWGYFEEYLRRIDNGHKPGAFAITTDGYGAFYVWCEETRCVAGATYSQDALNYCAREYDTDCVVFAVRDDIRVEYEVIGGGSTNSPEAAAPVPAPEPVAQQPSAPEIATPAPEPLSAPEPVAVVTAPKLAPPPPTARIAVSSAVQAEIDAYLGNTRRAGRAWALAIAHDGSEVASASCPTSGSWSGGRACEPVKGGPQELANREAIMRCGGAAACTLLYEGAQPRGNIEIVAQ